MKDINPLSKDELKVSRTACKMLYRITGIEHESWLANPYGGQNQLESEIYAVKPQVNHLMDEMNFGNPTRAIDTYERMFNESSQKYPGISRLLEIY